MRWLVLNGSPRGRASNSRLLVERLVSGITAVPGHEVEVGYLREAEAQPALVERLYAADAAIVVMPLYADAMPAIVKLFIERLEGLSARERRPKLGFVVQSGFPESRQSEPLARWLEKLTRRLGCASLGIVVRGGVEGIQETAGWTHRGLFRRFEQLGRSVAETGRFDPGVAARLARPRSLPAPSRLVFGALARLGLVDWMWNRALERNGALERRFDQPHGN